MSLGIHAILTSLSMFIVKGQGADAFLHMTRVAKEEEEEEEVSFSEGLNQE